MNLLDLLVIDMNFKFPYRQYLVFQIVSSMTKSDHVRLVFCQLGPFFIKLLIFLELLC